MVRGSEMSEGAIKRMVAAGTLRYAGNESMQVYGEIDCPSGKRSRKRVYFASREQAEQLGFRPCGACMRAEYQEWKRQQEVSEPAPPEPTPVEDREQRPPSTPTSRAIPMTRSQKKRYARRFEYACVLRRAQDLDVYIDAYLAPLTQREALRLLDVLADRYGVRPAVRWSEAQCGWARRAEVLMLPAGHTDPTAQYEAGKNRMLHAHVVLHEYAHVINWHRYGGLSGRLEPHGTAFCQILNEILADSEIQKAWRPMVRRELMDSTPLPKDRASFRRGMDVWFVDKKGIVTEGVIKKVNRTRCKVRVTRGAKWNAGAIVNVPMNMLHAGDRRRVAAAR